jgi:4-carboxymuconolactone decarboxylase
MSRPFGGQRKLGEILMPAKKKRARSPRKAAKPLVYRLPSLTEADLNPAQAALLESLRSGPRGRGLKLGGPFGCYMHAPEIGEPIQQLAAYCRFKTSLEKRLSEFAILVVGRIWKGQYEFSVHSREGQEAGIKAETVQDLKAGRVPKKAAKDERAIYDFIVELHKKRRVSDKTYARAHAVLGDKGLVELLAIIGSYTLTCMVLDTFQVPLPEGMKPPFAEPKV